MYRMSGKATAFPVDLQEEDCGGEIIECACVESEGGESKVATSNHEDDTEDLTADDLTLHCVSFTNELCYF